MWKFAKKITRSKNSSLWYIVSFLRLTHPVQGKRSSTPFWLQNRQLWRAHLSHLMSLSTNVKAWPSERRLWLESHPSAYSPSPSIRPTAAAPWWQQVTSGDTSASGTWWDSVTSGSVMFHPSCPSCNEELSAPDLVLLRLQWPDGWCHILINSKQWWRLCEKPDSHLHTSQNVCADLVAKQCWSKRRFSLANDI